MHVLEVAARCGRAGTFGVMATVIARRGSAPATPGQKLFAGADGTCVGTVGGGALEREVLCALEDVLDARAKAEHALRGFRLGPELGMCCGGSVDVLIEPLAPLMPCFIVGAGHVATALAPLLGRIGFAVTVADAREDWAKEGRIPGVTLIHGEYDDVGRDLPKGAVVLIMTHDHALDQQAVEWALKKGFAFVGCIGSRAKAERTKDRLLAKGFAPEEADRVRIPVGLGIGARLPDEIAISIAAELVEWKSKRGA